MQIAAYTMRAAALIVAAAYAVPGTLAQDGPAWTYVEGNARVTLPPATSGPALASAEMACASQVWTLLLDFGGSAVPPAGLATLAVPRGSFVAPTTVAGRKVSMVVPRQALEPMMAGTRLAVSLPGGTALQFPLAGSRRAVTSAAALCTPRDVAMADAVTLTPYSSYLGLARQLRREDVDDFTSSTSSAPRLRAAMVEEDGGRRLLLAELCGSSWYYGDTGCSLTGFVPVAGKPQDRPAGWRIAFESEGVFIRVIQENRNDGWPDLATIPLHEGSEETRWSWNGERYLPADAIVAAPRAQRNGG